MGCVLDCVYLTVCLDGLVGNCVELGLRSSLCLESGDVDAEASCCDCDDDTTNGTLSSIPGPGVSAGVTYTLLGDGTPEIPGVEARLFDAPPKLLRCRRGFFAGIGGETADIGLRAE